MFVLCIMIIFTLAISALLSRKNINFKKV